MDQILNRTTESVIVFITEKSTHISKKNIKASWNNKNDQKYQYTVYLFQNTNPKIRKNIV